MSSLGKAIEDAARHLKAEKIDGALEALLAAWPKHRSRELSDAIIALDAKLALPAFDGDTDAWAKAAGKAKPAQWGPLLATLTGKKLADAVERMHLARPWADDPRTANTIAALVAATPWSSDSSKGAWRAVYELVAASKSPRFVELAPSLKWNVRELIKGWLSNGYTHAIEALPATWAPIEAADAKALAALIGAQTPKKKPGSRDEASLLADVYAHPEEDAPRLVYADLLLERGDPRGEFINLQMSGSDPKREKALLAAHGKQWLGALAPALGADFEFRRGFLSKAIAKFRNQADAEKYGALAEWATIEDLTWMVPGQIPQGQEPFVRHLGPTMRPTARVDGAWAPALLAAKKPWQFEEAMGLGLSAPREFKALIESNLFPKLKALGVSDAIDVTWFSGITSMKNVKVLEARLVKGLEKLLPVVSKLGIERFNAWAMSFERGDDGDLSKLTFTLDKNSLRYASGMLHGIPEGLMTSIDFVLSRGLALPPELAAAAAKKVRAKGAARPVAATPSDTPEIEYARAAGFAADGSVIVADNKVLLVLDAAAKKVLHQFPIDQIAAARVLPGGRQVIATGYKRVHLFDVASGEDLVQGITREGGKSALPTSPDGRFVSFTSNGVFDLQKKVEVKSPRGSGKSLAVSPDHTWWLVWGGQGKPVELMRAGSNVKVPLEGSESAEAFAWAIAGDALLTRSETHLLRWSTTTGALTAKVAMKGHGALWLSPAGAFVATQVDKQTLVFDTASLTPRGKVSLGSEIGLSDDGTKAIICGDRGARVEAITG